MHASGFLEIMVSWKMHFEKMRFSKHAGGYVFGPI